MKIVWRHLLVLATVSLPRMLVPLVSLGPDRAFYTMTLTSEEVCLGSEPMLDGRVWLVLIRNFHIIPVDKGCDQL